MSIKIEDSFLSELKLHLRIFHNEDDALIKNEAEVAILNIWTQSMLQKEAELPASTKDLDPRVRLAVKHLATSYRSNPDDRLESKYIPYDKNLINHILGSQLGYLKEL